MTTTGNTTVALSDANPLTEEHGDIGLDIEHGTLVSVGKNGNMENTEVQAEATAQEGAIGQEGNDKSEEKEVKLPTNGSATSKSEKSGSTQNPASVNFAPKKQPSQKTGTRAEHIKFLHERFTQAFPMHLKRILSSDKISKEFGLNIYRLVDVGLMVKFRAPEKYTEFKGGELSLVTCVESLFGTSLDKSERLSTWNPDNGLTAKQVQYAGLDAQALLEVFEEAAFHLREKENSMGRIIPDDWYTLNFVDSIATHIVPSVRNQLLPWNSMLSPWYMLSQFQGYYM
ncbi:hypothetical protein C8J57DRAFT_1251321 [Mycena rebaudengoi]|nr:hypothetical protein C8J57DRAFT_1251321 [Mycena rebaudengoi]